MAAEEVAECVTEGLLLGNGDSLTLEQIRKGRGFRFGGVDLLTLSACETAKGGGAVDR